MILEDEFKKGKYSSIMDSLSQIQFDNRSFEEHYYYVKASNRMSNVHESIKYIKSVIGRDESISDFQFLKLLYELLWAYHKQGDWYDVDDYLDRAFQIINQLNYDNLEDGKKDVVISITNLAGIIYYSLGNLNKAMKYYNELMEKKSDIDNDKMIQGLKINIALVFMDKGEYIKSISYLKDGLELAEKYKNDHYIRVAANNLSYIYATIGNLSKAEEYAIKAMNIAKRQNDKWGLALISNNMGQIMYKKGNYEEAMKHLNQGHELLGEFDNPEYIIRILFYKLLVHLDLDNRFDANEVLQEIRKYSNQSDHARSQLICKLSDAIYLKFSGLYRDKFEAEIKFKELIEADLEIESEHISYSYLFLTELLLEQLIDIQSKEQSKIKGLQDNEEKILSEVLQLSEKIFKIADQQNVPELKLQVHYIQAHLAMIDFDPDKMMTHLQEAHLISKEWGLENVPISEPEIAEFKSSQEEEPLPIKLVTSINDIIHSLPRLKIMIALSKEPRITFSQLQDIVDLSSGSLSNHCKILIEKGYLQKIKEVVDDKFQTIYVITNYGIQAFDNYTSKLKMFFPE